MNPPSRRRFLTALALAAPTLAVPQWARAAIGSPPGATPRTLEFTHLHTGERLSVEYFDGGRYLPDGLQAVNRLLRDFRTAEVGRIDPQLLDLLHALAQRTESRAPFEVISGFRSSATNESLRSRQRHSGVALKSLHLVGQAIDIRVPGVALPHLRDAALSLGAGGVGYYASSGFVHVDTGRVRAW